MTKWRKSAKAMGYVYAFGLLVLVGGALILGIMKGVSNAPPEGCYSIVIDLEGADPDGFALSLGGTLEEWDSGAFLFQSSSKLFSDQKEVVLVRKLSEGYSPVDFLGEIERLAKSTAPHSGVTLHNVTVLTDDGSSYELK